MLHSFEDVPQNLAEDPGIIDDKDFDRRKLRGYFGGSGIQDSLSLQIFFDRSAM
jgi:hypothetical protein